ncbi:hypothetical protein BKA02_002294 [Microbacterium pseudoresistens]|uniref:Uncharacterized protein n=1 Tax=Microbacterium pseudoresistens TaxID=640634 RepID=A0A7Y9JQ16_9MICO|nr:hypothetical protein [Microbacterium pseudoresistens]
MMIRIDFTPFSGISASAVASVGGLRPAVA